jgi:2-hydroxyacyl-CoA lyase 1
VESKAYLEQDPLHELHVTSTSPLPLSTDQSLFAIMSTGAQIIARALHDLGVQVIFGVPGLPVTDIGQEGLHLGIRFISFRNEQAAAYAATAYGYLTGKPGVCISVGGPGVFHVMAGVC